MALSSVEARCLAAERRASGDRRQIISRQIISHTLVTSVLHLSGDYEQSLARGLMRNKGVF
jgi:hypothetical protein